MKLTTCSTTNTLLMINKLLLYSTAHSSITHYRNLIDCTIKHRTNRKVLYELTVMKNWQHTVLCFSNQNLTWTNTFIFEEIAKDGNGNFSIPGKGQLSKLFSNLGWINWTLIFAGQNRLIHYTVKIRAVKRWSTVAWC